MSFISFPLAFFAFRLPIALLYGSLSAKKTLLYIVSVCFTVSSGAHYCSWSHLSFDRPQLMPPGWVYSTIISFPDDLNSQNCVAVNQSICASASNFTPQKSLMMQSMTGFGSHRSQLGAYRFLSEVKTLNSKSLDIRLRIPSAFRELEAELRHLIQEHALRGKIEFSLTLEGEVTEEHYYINEKIFSDYYTQLSQLAEKHGFQLDDPVSSIVRLPNIYVCDEIQLSDEIKTAILANCTACIQKLVSYRTKEGDAVQAFLREKVRNIEKYRKEVARLSPQRTENVRERLEQGLKLIKDRIEIDQNRYEQEILYYLEKNDIEEENQRLEQHCAFFTECLESKNTTKGRKLGFISQEMGREINTMGSKANDAEIQRLVVNMKDELEKIKEQLPNIV